MEIHLGNRTILFEVINVSVRNKNQIDIFQGNKKTLKYKLEKAIVDKENRLHKFAARQIKKYRNYLNYKLGDFLLLLKNERNDDYLLYLNKYGDEKFCNFSIDNFQDDKGIYVYIIDECIKYIGRSKKTFEERFKDYGKITPYNCLIDGQSTNCRINSRINNYDSFRVGFYKMNSSNDNEIKQLEKDIINHLTNNGYDIWNIQLN